MSFQLLFTHKQRTRLVLYFGNANSTHLIKVLGNNWKCSNCDKIEGFLNNCLKIKLNKHCEEIVLLKVQVPCTLFPVK